jgi:SAM-dependent methyltransferase
LVEKASIQCLEGNLKTKKQIPTDYAVMKKSFKRELVRFYIDPLGERKKILDLNPGFDGIYNDLKDSNVDYVCLEQNFQIRSFLKDNKINVKNWEIPNIPAKEDSIDYVLSAPFIEHLPTYIDALDFLLEVKRVLKPGGRILLIVPNYLSIKEIFFEDYKHGWITTKKRIIDMLLDCHYEIMGSRYTIGWITMRMNPLTSISRVFFSMIMGVLRINIIHRFLEAIKLDTLSNKLKKTFFELVVVEAQINKNNQKSKIRRAYYQPR